MATYPDTSNTWPNPIDVNAMIAAQVAPVQAQCSQSAVLTTNGAGRVSWTFPTPFDAPPVISADVLAAAGQPYALKLVSLDATQVTIDVLGAAVVSVLSVNVLAALTAAAAGLSVHIIATKRGT